MEKARQQMEMGRIRVETEAQMARKTLEKTKPIHSLMQVKMGRMELMMAAKLLSRKI